MMPSAFSPDEIDQLKRAAQMFEMILDSGAETHEAFETLKDVYVKLGMDDDFRRVTARFADYLLARDDHDAGVVQLAELASRYPDEAEWRERLVELGAPVPAAASVDGDEAPSEPLDADIPTDGQVATGSLAEDGAERGAVQAFNQLKAIAEFQAVETLRQSGDDDLERAIGEAEKILCELDESCLDARAEAAPVGEPESEEAVESEYEETEVPSDPKAEPVQEAAAEPVEAEAADAEPADAEAAETEMADAEPADAEAAETEMTDDESSDTEPADAEAADAEPVETEAADDEAVDAEPADAESAETEAADDEAVDEEAAETEPADDEPIDAEAAETEVADAEAVDAEPAETEAADDEAVDEEAAETEPADDEPIDAEAAKTEPTDAEAVEAVSADDESIDAEPAEAEPEEGESPEAAAPVETEPADEVNSSLRLGEMMVEQGVITRDNLETALAQQRESGELLGNVLIGLGYATEPDVLHCLALQAGVPYLPLGLYEVQPELAALLPESFARQHRIVPVDVIANSVLVSIAARLKPEAKQELESLLGERKINYYISAQSEIDKRLDELYAPPGPSS